MIKFFRKIRQKLLQENRVSKYLIYALGEIVLVVIGILIALQINNWNEDKKALQLEKEIYAVIKSDLKSDISNIESFLEYYDSVRKPLFISFLNEKLTLEDVTENPELLKGFIGWPDIKINNRGYELFKNQPNSAIIDQDLAKHIAKFYNKHLNEIEVAEQELAQEFTDNNFHFKRKGFTWKYVIGKDDEKFTEYYLIDEDAKNRMAAYYLFFRIYSQELRAFKTNAEELIESINTTIND